jgi:uncharacterized protein YjbI with pentapeptide repeats
MSRKPHAVSAPAPPRLDGELADLVLEPDRLTGVDGARIAGGDLAGIRASGVTFVAARLIDVDLSRAHLRGLRLADVAVERGNLANLAAPELSLRRVAITGARLTGANWTRGTISDVLFRDCRIDLAIFTGTTFERTTFERCRLAQADFGEALLRSVRFHDCDLTEAELNGVRIDGCELHGCTLDGLVGLERLRGAAMPWADVVGNAGLLAAALGIRVIDDARPGGDQPA